MSLSEISLQKGSTKMVVYRKKPKPQRYKSFQQQRHSEFSNFAKKSQYLPSLNDRNSHNLESYIQKLKQQINYSQKPKEKKDYKRENIHRQRQKIQQKNSIILSEMESIKYRLKSLSLSRQSHIMKKQKLIKLKTEQNSLHLQNSMQFYPGWMPHLNLFQMQHSYLQHQGFIHSNFSTVPDDYIHKQRTQVLRKRSTKFGQLSQNQITQPKRLKQFFNQKQQNKVLQKKQFQLSKFKKRINQFKRFQNREQVRKLLKKCFLAVYSLKCLEKLYKKMIKGRRNFYLSFWPSQFKKFQQTFKDYFYEKFLPFFKLLKSSQFSSLLSTENDTKALKLQKNKTIRELIKLFFECFKNLKDIDALGKVAWGFCKHGSFVNQGVLTINQLEYVCFNQKYGYLRMDENLQKCQIINFLFVKIILNKFLLYPWKKWMKQYNPLQNIILHQNLKVVGSTLYNLFLSLQEQYLDKVDQKIYPLNNFTKLKLTQEILKVQFSIPLLYETKKTQKELISGLYNVDFLKKHVSFKKIHPYLQTAKQVMQKIHQTSRKYHKQYRDKINSRVQKTNFNY